MSKHNRERKRLWKLGLTRRQLSTRFSTKKILKYLDMHTFAKVIVEGRVKLRGVNLYRAMQAKTWDTSIGVPRRKESSNV